MDEGMRGDFAEQFKKLFELFSLGQKGIFLIHTPPFFQPVVLTTNFKKDFVCLKNLLFCLQQNNSNNF
jgi:hypothetical protein